MLKRLAANLTLVLAGVVIALLIGELALRVVNRHFPYFFCYDAQRGWGLKPGASGHYDREGESWVQINADGFRVIAVAYKELDAPGDAGHPGETAYTVADERELTLLGYIAFLDPPKESAALRIRSSSAATSTEAAPLASARCHTQ